MAGFIVLTLRQGKEIKTMNEKELHKEYFTEPLAPELEEMREQARLKRRISYDCFNAIFKANRVGCKAGHSLSRIGTLPLFTILRGRSAYVCQSCPDYDGDKDHA